MHRQYLEYLQYVKQYRHSPYEFWVIYQDYTKVHIEDIQTFYLETLRKPIIGVAIHVPGEMWVAWFTNPSGGTLEKLFWKPEDAVYNIAYTHDFLTLIKDRKRAFPPEDVLSDVRKYANPS